MKKQHENSAEEILKIVAHQEERIQELKMFFYPAIANIELANENITKCLKELR